MDIVIRDVSKNDASRIADIYRYYVDYTAVTYEEEAPEAAEILNRIKSITQKYPYIVAEADGEVIAYAYASVFKDRESYRYSVETSIYIEKDKRNLGIGSVIYQELEKRLKDMGIKNMYACIAYIDKPDEYLSHQSVIFHEKSGFRTVGCFYKCAYKFNRWYDMIWMEKFIGDHA